MTPSRFSATFLGSFLVTVFFLQWWQEALYPTLLFRVLVASLGLSLAGCVHPRFFRIAPWFFAGLFGLSLAFLAVSRTTHVPTPETVDFYARGERVAIRGIVVDDPDRRSDSTKYTIEASALMERGTGSWMPIGGRVLAMDYLSWPLYEYGDEVFVSGTMVKPEPFDNFRYDRYLSLSRIYSTIRGGSLAATGQNGGTRIFSLLFSTKHWFETRLEQLLPEPHASFAEGLITGSRRGIPENLMQDFTATGLTHVVAISGYNITIVMTILSGLLFWLPIRWRLLPTIAAVAAFTVFVGASASVVRAAIMGTIGCIAVTAGRQRDMRLTILWTIFIMLNWNPKQLWYDPGFQLSFAAVVGLTELSSLLKPLLKIVPQTLGLRESLVATLAAQIAAMPLAVLLFGNLPLIAPLANILVAPAIPCAMLLVSAAILFSTVSFAAGLLFASFGWSFLQWIILVATFFSEIPGGSFQIHHVSALVVAAYYVLLTASVLFMRTSLRAHQR